MGPKSFWGCVGLGVFVSLLSPSLLRAQNVRFDNAVLVPHVTDGDVLVRTSQGAPLTGTNFVAQLYYGTSASALIADTAAPARSRVPTTSQPGTWIGQDRNLTGFSAGSLIVLAVRVWDITTGSTYEQASSRGDCGPFYF